MSTAELLSAAYKRRRARLAMLATLCGGDDPLIVTKAMIQCGQTRWWERHRELQRPVYWDKERPGFAHMNHEDPAPLLRFIGAADVESSWGQIVDHSRGNHIGWFTNNDGFTSKDGDGLVWGVVYQLPPVNRCPRFVGGYQFGGCGMGPTLDLKEQFIEEVPLSYGENHRECTAARHAARHADCLAQEVAEREREYQESEREDEDEDKDEDEDR